MGNIMFVNQVPFLVLSACWIGLVTTEYLPVITTKAIANNVHQVIHLYCKGGFTIQTILMDNKFNKIKADLQHAIINMTAANEHVSGIECWIRVLKEWGQGIICALPFKNYL